MKTPRMFMRLALGLGLGLSLTLTSCKDNDLDGNGGNHTDGTEQTDLEWEKQINLQRLLGAFADVDSLPSNWNSSSYHETTPTIGQAADDATPYSVRLVATSSVEEAYLEYCSYVGKASGDTPTTDTWKMDGIGSLTFTANNQANLYATVSVNLQQLPALQEIRFVPASALGTNDGKDEAYYYNYGDIIKQTVNNKDTYWVCVRPANKSLGLGQTHWCTFQLDDDNYKEVEKDVFLPTGLSKSEAKSQRMVTNFFNLLRVINDPSIYKGAPDLEKIGHDKFKQEDVEKISRVWKDNNYWELIEPAFFGGGEPKKGYTKEFVARFTDEGEAPHVLHYGYTGKYPLFSKNTYKVYDLALSLDENKKFFNANPQNINVDWFDEDGNPYKVDLRHFIVNPENDQNYCLLTDETDDEEDKGYNNTFIVKHRTGAQLQGRWLNDLNDSKPTVSFVTSASGKGITDVFVYNKDGKYQQQQQEGFTPYFSFGDMVTKGTKQHLFAEGEQHICIKPAHNVYGTVNPDNYAYFVSTNSQPAVDYYGEMLTNEEALYVAFQMLRSYILDRENDRTYICPLSELADDYNLKEADQDVLNEINSVFSENKAIYGCQKNILDKNSNEYYYELSVNLYTNESVIKNKKLARATVYTMRYYPDSKDNKYRYVKKVVSTTDASCTHFVPVYKYEDINKEEQTYGISTSQYIQKIELREFFKKHMQDFLKIKFSTF